MQHMVIQMTHRVPFDLYIASHEKEGGVYQYRITDPKDPELICFTPMDRPMYMTVAKEKMYILLRAPFGCSESGLVFYHMDEQGVLHDPSETVSTKGEVACHLSANGADVYAVNYISGSVIKMPDRIVTHSGKGIHPERQTLPHTHFVSPSPDGRYILVTDLGTDKIYIYRKDLTLVSTVDIPSGHGPRHLAFHEDKTHVFCVNELKSTVSLLHYKAGTLRLLDTVPVLPKIFDGESTAAAIRCVNNRVFVSNRGHDSIAILEYADDGLTLRKFVSTHGRSPRDFVVYQDLIVVANEQSDKVTLISANTGQLLGEVDVKSPICVTARNNSMKTS